MEDDRDVLMMMELTPGKFVPAECRAVIDTADTLANASGVPRARNKMSAGRFFAIEDFSLDAGLASRGGGDATARFLAQGPGALRGAGGAGGAFVSDIEPISITKRLDRSSTTLLDRCMTSFKFTSATILKRKAIGADMLRGYLRFDFFDVMLTELNWDDEGMTKETFKFVCRGVVVQYSAETFSGSASGAAVLTPGSPAEWKVLQSGS